MFDIQFVGALLQFGWIIVLCDIKHYPHAKVSGARATCELTKSAMQSHNMDLHAVCHLLHRSTCKQSLRIFIIVFAIHNLVDLTLGTAKSQTNPVSIVEATKLPNNRWICCLFFFAFFCKESNDLTICQHMHRYQLRFWIVWWWWWWWWFFILVQKPLLFEFLVPLPCFQCNQYVTWHCHAMHTCRRRCIESRWNLCTNIIM